MVTKEQKFRLGLFVVVSFIILIIILATILVPKLQRESSTYYIRFKEISVYGVNEGSKVKYQGVDVGIVDDIKVDPKDLDTILVTVQINKGFPVKKDMSARLAYAGITGLKYIEISGGKNKSENLEPYGEIPVKLGLGEKAEQIVANLDDAFDSLNEILGKKNRDNLALVLENLEKSTREIHQTMQKNNSKLDKTIDNIEATSHQLKRIGAYLDETLPKLQLDKIAQNTIKITDSLAERLSKKEVGKVIDNITHFTENASSSIRKIDLVIQDVGREVNITLESLREIMQNLSKFSRDLAEQPSILFKSKKNRRSRK